MLALVTQRAQFHLLIDAIEKRGGSSRLNDIERTNADRETNRIEQNISEILENTSSVPIGFINLKPDVERMNEDVPVEKSVFLMTKFPDRPDQRLKDKQLDVLTKAIAKALRPYGLIVRRADQKNYASSKQVWDNVGTYMIGCK